MNFSIKIVTFFAFLLALTLLALTLLVSPDVEGDTGDGDEDHDHCMDGYWDNGWGAPWMITMIIGGSLIALLFFMISRTSNGAHSSPIRTSAANLAMDRYARGEIDRNEYLRIIEDLKR